MTVAKQLEDAVFFTALQIKDAGQRRAFLDHACMEDRAFRGVVEEMLASLEDADRLMDRGYSAIASNAGDLRGSQVDELPRDEESVDERIGKRIDRYTLVQNLGEGGCGAVFLAEQESPVRRLVALKVIKLGMDTRNVMARFDAERQALAMMDHPNIARVLDAGATDTGRPYFVLELVRGTRITDFCDANHCGLRQRLELFILTCKAIQHAHQKGIIHRDIKPSNVLVAMHDGVAVPKVIDFGIAKAIEGRLTDETVHTQHEQLLGTPAYMSPEQADLRELDVDTRSDVYSLGVLLYELLTGRTPFDGRELSRAGLDGMRRILRERVPQRPSATLAGLDIAVLKAAAEARATDAPKLVSGVNGDLDWIVMKALEKERTRRYDTANGLAMDVQRYLLDQPIYARPPGRLYLLGKLVRRNVIVFVAGLVVLLALVIGFSTSTWLYFKAKEAERHQAELRQVAENSLANEAALRREAESREKLTEAVTLVRQGDYPGAAKALETLEIPPTRPSLDGVTALRAVGAWLAVQGHWRESAERFGWLFEIDKLDTWGLVTLNCQAYGAVLVESSNPGAYAHFCKEVSATHTGSSNGDAVSRILKTCLLLPPDKEVMGRLQPLGDTTEGWFSRLDANSKMGWAAVPSTLWRYRNGDNAGAIQSAWPAMQRSDSGSALNPTVRAILAMATHRTGNDDEARKQLALAREIVDQRFKIGLEMADDSRGCWYDWVFARILVREATALMSDEAGGPAVK